MRNTELSLPPAIPIPTTPHRHLLSMTKIVNAWRRVIAPLRLHIATIIAIMIVVMSPTPALAGKRSADKTHADCNNFDYPEHISPFFDWIAFQLGEILDSIA